MKPAITHIHKEFVGVDLSNPKKLDSKERKYVKLLKKVYEGDYEEEDFEFADEPKKTTEETKRISADCQELIVDTDDFFEVSTPNKAKTPDYSLGIMDVLNREETNPF